MDVGPDMFLMHLNSCVRPVNFQLLPVTLIMQLDVILRHLRTFFPKIHLSRSMQNKMHRELKLWTLIYKCYVIYLFKKLLFKLNCFNVGQFSSYFSWKYAVNWLKLATAVVV
jgi:hypothetical protein